MALSQYRQVARSQAALPLRSDDGHESNAPRAERPGLESFL